MRRAGSVAAGIIAGTAFAAVVFLLNHTIGRWFLHWLPVYWCTTVHRDGTESYCWSTAATVVDWIYAIAYLVPTTIFAFGNGFDWGRHKVAPRPEAS